MGTYFPAFALSRDDIEARINMHLEQVDKLIRRLDRADAIWEDLEDDDPAGDPSEQDAASDAGRAISPVLPQWGINQTRGPSNVHEPHRQYMIAELGLVRSPSGGWRHP